MAYSIKNIFIFLAMLNAGPLKNMLLSVQLATHAYRSWITEHTDVTKV